MDNERKILCDSIEIEENSRNAILDIMQTFAESTDSVNIESVDEVKSFLDNLKTSLNLYNENIELLKKIVQNIDAISESTSQEEENNSNNFSNSQASSFNYSFTPFSTSTPEITHNTVELDINPINRISEFDSISSFNKNVEASKEQDEDTLVISETEGKVVLPFKISELERILERNPKKFASIDDIIETEYTLPIVNFKNPMISRFREGFKLMYHKEKGSVISAFDLGMELMFNSKLHPAIITACKSLDELDNYLDCLEVNKTYKFELFKIVFEAPPDIDRKNNFSF